MEVVEIDDPLIPCQNVANSQIAKSNAEIYGEQIMHCVDSKKLKFQHSATSSKASFPLIVLDKCNSTIVDTCKSEEEIDRYITENKLQILVFQSTSSIDFDSFEEPV